MMARSILSAALAVGLLLASPPAAPSGKKEKVREEVAVIDINMGRIAFRFFEEKSPVTVRRFKQLAREGYYAGAVFSRVYPGLMIQGGSREREARDERTVPADTSPLDIETSDLKHRRGTVSMAHERDDPHSRSEFFICLQPIAYYDGRYTIIGEVIAGIEVVDAISNVPRNTIGVPLFRVQLRRVALEIQEFLVER